MKRVPFDQQPEHYDERLTQIDEQLCSLLKQRKEISNNNPGCPPPEVLSKWAEKYDLYEDLLRSLFNLLENEEHYRPRVEPINFQKYIPVLKSVEKEQCVYSVIFIRQYENASVINFTMDWEPEKEPNRERFHRHSFWELWVGEGFDCRANGGGGSNEHISYNFIVSPPLPEDITGLALKLTEYNSPFKKNPTGLEIIMHL